MPTKITGLCAMAFGLALCGCASFDRAVTYTGIAKDDSAVVIAEPAPPARIARPQPNSDWCARVADNDLRNAKSDGMDAATQQREARTSYTQCMAGAVL